MKYLRDSIGAINETDVLVLGCYVGEQITWLEATQQQLSWITNTPQAIGHYLVIILN